MAVTPYILAARSGRNHAWRYLATYFLVILLVLLGSVVPQHLVRLEQSAEGLVPNLPDLLPPSLLLALKLFPFVFVPLGLWFGLSQLHHRSFYSLISAEWSFHWRRFFLSAGLWLLLLGLSDLFLAWRIPERYSFTFDPEQFFPFLAAALLLVPIQAAGEEMLYRGYLAQGFGLKGGFWLAWLAPSLLFGLLHYSPGSTWMQVIPVVGLSLILGWITLRSSGLELAMGLHVMHNLYAVTVVASPVSTLPSSAFYTVRAPSALASTAPAALPEALTGSLASLELIVYPLAGLLYLILIALLGRDFFPLGLFGRPWRGLNRLTQPRGLQCVAGLLGLAALISSSGCLPQAKVADAAGSPGMPALALEDCTLKAGSTQIRAQCGKLSVYEDRAAASGKQIELNVAVIRSVSREPAPDPVFLLAGGPGQAATEVFPLLLGALERVRFKRDLVMVDQRGTGGSNPLSCPELEDDPQVFGVELPLEEQLAQLQSCRDELGVDPRLYGTEIAMQDLDDVRQALGYEQINLLGISYGTRAALTYLRLFPERVRALVLDGVVPPNWVLGSAVSGDAQRSLDRIFSRCAQDSACREAFPTLEEDFASLLAALEDQPVEVRILHPLSGQPVQVEMSPTTIGNTVRLMSYNDLTTALLPLGIHAAASGDYTMLAGMYLQVIEELNEGIHQGMHQSVLCYEDAPLLEEADGTENYYLESPVADLRAYCQVWAPDALPPPALPAQTWDTPALLISGEVDPVTPPENGAETAAWLPNSTHLVLPGMGHSNFYVGCMPEIVLRFIQGASVSSLEIGCLDTIQPMPFFLSPAGPQP